MNRTRGTPGKTQKVIPECKDVEQEFAIRALSLLASFYDTPSTDEISTFPPVKCQEIPPQEENIPFESPIIDHRLKRYQEKRVSRIANENSTLSSKAEEISQGLSKTKTNLEDIFTPDKPQRPAKPIYLLNAEMDRKKDMEKKHNPQPHIDMKTIQKIYRARLKESERRGKERLERRNTIMNESICNAQIPPSPRSKISESSITKTPQDRKREARQAYDRRTKWQPEGGYKNLVNKKSE